MTAVRRPAKLAAAALAVIVGVSALGTPAASAAEPVGLGTADSFAVLAGSGITNTGSTTITGDIGSSPTPAITGTGSITLTGTNHADDDVTDGAKVDLNTAYLDAFGRTPETSIAVELGGTTLLPGVYTSPTLGLTGVLTLDAAGDANAVFVFKAGSTLTTATNSSVLLINGANPCRVTWQIGSSATFGTRTSFVGDVLADTSITANTEATFIGRLLALDGAVTLDTNTISAGQCTTPAASAGTTVIVPAPTTTTTTTPATTTTTTPATTTTTMPVTTTTTMPATTTTTVPATTTSTTAPISPDASQTVTGASSGTVTPGLARLPSSSDVVPRLPSQTFGAGPGTPADLPGAPSAGSPPAAGAPGVPSLARTGSDTGGLVATAVVLLALGTVSSIAGRRRT